MRLAASAVWGAVLLAGLAGDNRQGARMPVAESLDALHARCVDAMVRQTCRVMNGAPESSVPLPGAVFIAGLGAVDAIAYSELRQAGDSMCSLGVAACEAASEGSRCQTWRALWRSSPTRDDVARGTSRSAFARFAAAAPPRESRAGSSANR